MPIGYQWADPRDIMRIVCLHRDDGFEAVNALTVTLSGAFDEPEAAQIFCNGCRRGEFASRIRPSACGATGVDPAGQTPRRGTRHDAFQSTAPRDQLVHGRTCIF